MRFDLQVRTSRSEPATCRDGSPVRRLTATPLSYWRSASGLEVNVILNGETAIAVHSSKQIDSSALRGLWALQEEGLLKRYLLVCCELEERVLDEIMVLPWQSFIKRLWVGELV